MDLQAKSQVIITPANSENNNITKESANKNSKKKNNASEDDDINNGDLLLSAEQISKQLVKQKRPSISIPTSAPAGETHNNNDAGISSTPSSPTILQSNSSFDSCILQKNERRVLVIYTGGTIGMVRSHRGAGLVPLKNTFEKTLRKFPNLHDENYAKSRFGDMENYPLVLPEMMDDRYRVMYTIYEYDPLLDSTDMTMDDWVQIAQDIKVNYEKFDGFVILHGTDTMSYTASALSFMLDHLGKSVVITGSQIPLFEIRSDGRENFLGALILAGSYVIPEVTVYFGQKLFRGNRITKVSSDSLNAFDSPNMAPIAVMGINIEVNYNLIFRPKDIAPFSINTSLNRNVGLLRLFPSITPETVRVFLQEPTLGVVLQTYGSGNFPTNRNDLLKELELAAKRGVLIVNCTQCGHGSVSAIYETGQTMTAAGVIICQGYDMTPEAALTKLSYVLGRDDWDINKKREMMQKCLKGELLCQRKNKADDDDALNVTGGHGKNIVESVAQTLGSSLGIEYSDDNEITTTTATIGNCHTNCSALEKVIGPPLHCSLLTYFIETDRKEFMDRLFENSEAVISMGDYSGRTPLHIAAALGDIEVVEFLLKKGASVHLRDNRGYSPLRDAIEHDRHEVIEILRKCGAHLTLEPKALGAELNLATCRGDIKRLNSFLLAGANLNQIDPTGRAPLHVAVESNNTATVEWLLTVGGVSPCIKNQFGQTPMDLAMLLQNKVMVDLMHSAFSSKANGQCSIM